MGPSYYIVFQVLLHNLSIFTQDPPMRLFQRTEFTITKRNFDGEGRGIAPFGLHFPFVTWRLVQHNRNFFLWENQGKIYR